MVSLTPKRVPRPRKTFMLFSDIVPAPPPEESIWTKVQRIAMIVGLFGTTISILLSLNAFWTARQADERNKVASAELALFGKTANPNDMTSELRNYLAVGLGLVSLSN